MSTKKVYAVVFYEQAVEQLGRIVALWLRQDEMGSYMYCKSIYPAGPYFSMILEFRSVKLRHKKWNSRYRTHSSNASSMRQTTSALAFNENQPQCALQEAL